MVARLLKASSQNGAARPSAAVTTPLSAGPIARLMLTPTLFTATAPCSSSRGTSIGTIACQAGASKALPVATTNMNTSKSGAVTRPRVTSVAKIAAITRIPISTPMRYRRLSTMSVMAPAGRANRNIGRLEATCTRDTSSGSVVSSVMSHAAAALYIHPPVFETTVAVHTTA